MKNKFPDLLDIKFEKSATSGILVPRKNIEVAHREQEEIKEDDCYWCGAKTTKQICMSEGLPEPICDSCIKSSGPGILVKEKGVPGWSWPNGIESQHIIK